MTKESKRPRLQVYLKRETHQAYTAYKNQRNIDSDSEALNRILSEFLGMDKTQSNLMEQKISAAIVPILRRIEQLESQSRNSS